MTIRGWSALALGTALAGWAIAAALLSWNYQCAMSQQVHLLRTWAPAVAQASALGRAQAGASEMLNDAVLRSRVRRPERLERQLIQMHRSVAELEQLLADQPVERALVRHADTRQEDWLSNDLHPTLEALARGGSTAAAAITASEDSAVRTESMQRGSRILHALLSARSIAHSQAMASSARSLRDALVIALAAVIIAIIAGASIIRLGIERPLRRLRTSLRRAMSDAEHPVAIPQLGPADVAAVARDAEGLRRRMVEQEQDAQAARESLGLHAPLVAEVRHQLHGLPIPSMAGMQAFASTRPAVGVIGGDWWQFLLRPSGNWCMVVADVSGHGWESGLVALQMRAVMDAWLRSEAPLEAVVSSAASSLGSGEHTVPAVLVEFDLVRGLAWYVNAGHPPPVQVRADGSVDNLTRTGPLLSCLSGGATAWTRAAMPWQPGDVLVAYSDGLLDRSKLTATDPAGWLRSAAAALPPTARLDPKEFGAGLLAGIRQDPQQGRDDASLIVVARSTIASQPRGHVG